MKGDIPAWLTRCVSAVRRRCIVRQVQGTQYPVPKWELERWEEEQLARRRHLGRKHPRYGAQLHFREIFRGAT